MFLSPIVDLSFTDCVAYVSSSTCSYYLTDLQTIRQAVFEEQQSGSLSVELKKKVEKIIEFDEARDRIEGPDPTAPYMYDKTSAVTDAVKCIKE